MMNRGITFAVLTALLLLLGRCDTDRFVGFRYEARQIAQFVEITGKVSNVFTNEGVPNATLSFSGQVAQSDSFGRFSLDYALGSDEEFNRPVPVTITADKYFVLDTSLVVFPENNVLNVALIYAAPIIRNTARNGTGVSAIIFDYQGVADLDSVLTGAWYNDAAVRKTFVVNFPMTQARIIDSNSAEYQVELPPVATSGTLTGALLDGRHKIIARDREGFEESRVFIY